MEENVFLNYSMKTARHSMHRIPAKPVKKDIYLIINKSAFQ